MYFFKKKNTKSIQYQRNLLLVSIAGTMVIIYSMISILTQFFTDDGAIGNDEDDEHACHPTYVSA
jgi:hypothetical protein